MCSAPPALRHLPGQAWPRQLLQHQESSWGQGHKQPCGQLSGTPECSPAQDGVGSCNLHLCTYKVTARCPSGTTGKSDCRTHQKEWLFRPCAVTSLQPNHPIRLWILHFIYTHFAIWTPVAQAQHFAPLCDGAIIKEVIRPASSRETRPACSAPHYPLLPRTDPRPLMSLSWGLPSILGLSG